MSHIVQVRALEKEGRTGPYNRAGLHFVPGFHEYQVSADQLKTIEADYWLEVRILDELSQASRKSDFAKIAALAADAAEATAKELRAHADKLHEEASLALEAVNFQAPSAPERPTPIRDALAAAVSSELYPAEPKAKKK